MTPIGVKSHIIRLKCFRLDILQLVILKMLQLQRASPLTSIKVTSHISNAEIAYLMICYFENASGFNIFEEYTPLLESTQLESNTKTNKVPQTDTITQEIS